MPGVSRSLCTFPMENCDLCIILHDKKTCKGTCFSHCPVTSMKFVNKLKKLGSIVVCTIKRDNQTN